jgi:small GTP-binding protein
MEIERSQDPNTVKVIFVGESSTGKTSLINNIFQIEINPSQPSTCIPNQRVYQLQMPSSQEVLLSIWDTAGQEKFRSLNKLFFKDAKIAIIVIDIIQKKTFEAVDEFWYPYIREICGEHCVIGIAENKVDLFEKEQVTENEVREYIKDKDIISERTSAVNGTGIEELLTKLVERYLDLVEKNIIPNKQNGHKSSLSKVKNGGNKKKDKCC